MKIIELVNYLDFRFNISLQEKWDRSGLQTSIYQQSLTNIHYCLDVTEVEINEAIKNDANFIFSHHPLWINEKMRTNAFNTKIEKLLKMNNIVVYSAHTNYDNMHDGLTYQLVKMLGWNPIANVDENCGLICNIDSISIEKLAQKLIDTFDVEVKVYKNNDEKIQKVAFINGSGEDFYNSAFIQKCDVLITGDISHHEKIEAKDLGFNLIDLSHEVEKHAITDFKKITAEILDSFNTML